MDSDPFNLDHVKRRDKMTVGTIFRVDTKVDLPTSKLRALAAKHASQAEEINITQTDLAKVDRQTLYTERYQLLCAGAKFLLDRLPQDYPSMSVLQRKALTNYIEQLEQGYIAKLKATTDNISNYQKILRQYSQMLVAALAHQLNIGTTSAVKWLSKAEEYHLLTQPRKDLMTLIKITNAKGNFYLIQKEAQLPPLSQELIEDYWKIRQQQTPYPEWYQALDSLEQVFLKHILKQAQSKAAISDVIVNLSSRLRTLPGAANFRNHGFYLYDEELRLLTSDERPASSMISSRDMQDQAQEIRDFHTMQNLRHIIDQCIDDKITDELDEREFKEGEAVKVKIPFLVQTLVSPLIPTFLQADYNLVVDKNRAVDKLVYTKQFPQTVKTVEGNTVKITVDVEVELQSTNHSLNYANRWDYTIPTDESCKKFITSVIEFLSTNPEHPARVDIRALLAEYENVLKLGSLIQANYYDLNMRELYLSSLEQLITARQNGIAYGSCVSAKDRKALEFLHTDAMELYRYWYGTWPSYQDVDSQARAQFIDIFSALYLSRHHHVSAALNAPGAEGIKTPTMYLPEDILSLTKEGLIFADATEKDPHKVDDRLASNNELRSIVKASGFMDFSWSAIKEQVKITLAEMVEELSDTATESPLSAVTNNTQSEINFYILESLRLIKIIAAANSEPLRKFWNDNTSLKANPITAFGVFSYSRPDGVKGIDRVFKKNSELNLALVPQIFAELSSRLKIPYGRYGKTTEFYTLIQSLFFERESLSETKAVYQALRKFHYEATKVWPLDKKPPVPEVDEAIPVCTL